MMADSGNGTPHLWVPGESASWRPGLKAKRTEHFDRAKMGRFAEFWDLLKDRGLLIVCARCTQEFGYGHDAVKPNHKPESNELVLECGCTRRVFTLEP